MAKTELYFNAGAALRSNDARASNTSLVGARGVEIGLGSEGVPGCKARCRYPPRALPNGVRGRRRHHRAAPAGAADEWSNHYKANRWLGIDANLAFARARFRDADPAGAYIPGAVEGVASLAGVRSSGVLVRRAAAALFRAAPVD